MTSLLLLSSRSVPFTITYYVPLVASHDIKLKVANQHWIFLLLKTKKACAQKRKLPLDADDSESDESNDENKFQEDDCDDSGDSDTEENQNSLESTKEELIAFLRSLSPPVSEEETQRMWSAAAIPTLNIAKVHCRYFCQGRCCCGMFRDEIS